ncbi:MAG: hypothetical protein P8Y70_17930 [Candidatus Lokiarchaeota archaeon]
MKDLKKFLVLKSFEDKIFRFKSKYHPNLITNLSHEAYDLYLIKNSICDKLIEKIKEDNITIEKIKEFIKNQIQENKEKLHKTTRSMDSEYLQNIISAWETFL